MEGLPPTERQLDYLRALQRRLHLPDALLDNHTIGRFGVAVAGLDRAQASTIIGELADWIEVPAEMQRAQGQRDLPGFGT